MWAVLRSLVLIALLTDLSLYAQLNVGSITGTLKDPSGAVIPGAAVTATNEGTGISEQAITNSSGVYVIKLLKPANYTISVTHSAFQRFERKGVPVVSGETVTVDIELVVGQVTQTVTVTGAAAMLDTTASNVGVSRSSQEIQDLPTTLFGNSSRTAASIARTFAGVNWDREEAGAQEFMVISRSQINGQFPAFWGYKIDGVESGTGDAEAAQDFVSPIPDVVQEVRLTSNTDVSEGYTGGVNLSFTLKSGTNKLHGSIAEYNRVDHFESRQTFQAGVVPDKQNEGSWTLGGPVVIPHVYNGRDKTFFFASMDIFRYRNQGGSFHIGGLLFTVPTNAMREGDFRELLGPQIGTDTLGRPIFQGEIYNPATTRPDGRGGFIRDPYLYNGQLNVINPGSISPISAYFLSKIAPPNRPGYPNDWVGNTRLFRVDKDQMLIKIDHNINSTNRISFSLEKLMPWFISGKGTETGRSGHTFVGGGQLWLDPSIDTGFADDRDEHKIRANYVWAASPNVLFNFRTGMERSPNRRASRFPFTGPRLTAGCDAGLKGLPGCAAPNVNVQGMNSFGAPWNFNYFLTAFQKNPVNVDVSWSKGSHNFKFGTDFLWDVYHGITDFCTMGSFNFTDRITGQPGTSSTGSGIASFLVGQLDNANACTAPPGDLHTGANSFYVQDSWRATRKLTINYGLRWDQFWPTWEHKDRMSTFDPNLVNPATGTKGALSIFGQGSGRNGRHAIEERYFKAFGPQLGLAYAWNDRTVLRASYGISYGPAYIKWLGSNGPYTVVSSDGFSASRYATTLDNGITPAFNWTSGFPVPFPSSFPILDPTLDNGGTITFMDPDNRPPMNQNVSFEIERQLPGQMSLRVAYIGLLAHHLQTEYPYDLNSVPLKNLTLGSDLLEADVNSPQARAAGIKVPYSGFSGSVAQALKPFPQYNHINYVGAMLGNSTYHSLQVNLQKRLGHGLSFLASYAVQKQLSNVDFPGYNGQGSLSVRHPELIKQDGKRLLGKDQPQNFNISWDYELPFGTGHAFAGHASKPLNYVIGGWRLSAIQNYFSGRPISITTRATNPIAGVWPELVPGVPIRATGCGDYDPNNPAKNRYLNINAFRSDPTTYRGYSLGNFSQIPNIRSCGFQDEAIGLDKQLVLHEQWRLSLGTYWQNALNRHPWRGLVTDLGSPAFGQYTDVNPSRFIQFYMRLEF